MRGKMNGNFPFDPARLRENCFSSGFIFGTLRPALFAVQHSFPDEPSCWTFDAQARSDWKQAHLGLAWQGPAVTGFNEGLIHLNFYPKRAERLGFT